MLTRIISASHHHQRQSDTRGSYRNNSDRFREKRQYSQSYYKRVQRRRAILLGAVVTGVVVYKASEWVVDYLDEELEDKETVVVLGSGFGSLAFLDTLNPKKFDIKVVSPQSSFLFTPMIAEAAIGNIKIESIAEPVRTLGKRLGTQFEYFEAKCIDVDPENNSITCQTSTGREFNLDYDRLIFAVGSQNNTHNVSGIHNALFLTSLNDARRIRNRLVESYEQAIVPGVSDEEIERLLSFVVVGSGPVAQETAKCLLDYKAEMEKIQPELAKKTKITMISGYKDHINNFYDNSISTYFSKFYKSDEVKKIDTTVESLDETHMTLHNGEKIPHGMIIWSTGRSSNPLLETLSEKIPEQSNRESLVTDIHLLVKGTENIYAIGDCATIDQGKLFSKWEKYFVKSDEDNSGYIDLNEFKDLLAHKAHKYPALYQIGIEAESYFEKADINKDGQLELDEFREVMKLIDKNITRFPATATVATQQGTYLGETFNKYLVPGDDDEDDDGDDDEEIVPFRYKHIGGYEYVGAEDGFTERGSQGKGIVTGPGARWMWHSVYWSKSIPLKMRLSILWDKLYSSLYGRGTTRY
eukprot:TRINITY_DN6146_c0_g1_i1.p1 TRINITY_DN6146_c0_g1~~TRINITY_DN6146_c0_g1_i1.p1  ORF type:complete len:583 (-),score=133.09 TRINITY_DN6146_c0_g1_i1:36-1784(-)